MPRPFHQVPLVAFIPLRYPALPLPHEARWFRRRLLAWFVAHARPLPWRKNRDPYAVWVSEVMLQQTQAATVVPYFERFLKTFPSVRALAAASESSVLKLWEGLGYYRRARLLHRAAQVVVARHAGLLPRDAAALRRLPGFGRYTAHAVLSQAFGARLPIVEANSARLLTRLAACTAPLRSTDVERWLWQAAEKLVPPRAAGDFNQAMMELGALVCKPRQPLCERCPLAERCAARADGLQDTLPLAPRRPANQLVHEAALVVRRRDKMLLVQRPPQGRWANLWEFPHGSLIDGESGHAAVARLAADLAGLRVASVRHLGNIRHGVMHFSIHLACYEAFWAAGRFRSSFYQRGKWLRPAELTDYPLSVPQRRLASLISAYGGSPPSP